MRHCPKCGGKVYRIHRFFSERFAYLGIYQCHQCEDLATVPRRYRFHLGDVCRCPVCGTFRVSRLKEPDTIDRFHTGLLNWLERRAGGRLFHCRYCRLQFYDRRRTPAEINARDAGRRNVSADA